MTSGFALDPDLARLRRRRSIKWRMFGDDVLPAWVAEMDFGVPPAVRTALVEAAEAGDLGYAPAAPNVLGFGDAVASFAQGAWGWTINPEDVMAYPDVSHALEACVEAFSAPGDKVVVPVPIYPPFLRKVAEAGRRPIELAVEPSATGWSLDLEAYADALAGGARLVLLCHPHNPTGHVLAAHELQTIAALALEHDAVVVSDEIHAPLTYPPGRFVPMALAAGEAASHVVTLSSATKAWNIAGLGGAWAVPGRVAQREALLALPAHSRETLGLLGIVGTVAALLDDSGWLDAVRRRLDDNRHLLARLVAEQLPGVVYRIPQATYLAWLDCRALELGSDPAAWWLDNAAVALSRGPDFGRTGTGWTRLNFATTPAVLELIVTRMAEALQQRPPAGPQR